MSHPTLGVLRFARWLPGLMLLGASVLGQVGESKSPPIYDDDSGALLLARQYLQGGEGARPAVLDALRRMGWGVRDIKGAMLQAPPAGADTGLAMRDYELEELLWKPAEQPAIRLISVAQALTVPFPDADPEALAQDLVEAIRQGAESKQPQQRFWARFIVALGRVSPAGYDLAAAGTLPVMIPSQAQLKRLLEEAKGDPIAMLSITQPKLVWPADDPVLAPSPRPKQPANPAHPDAYERDQQRLNELGEELGRLSGGAGSMDAAKQKAFQEKMMKLTTEMALISQRQSAAMTQQTAAYAGRESELDGSDPRFIAEHREQPLSMLQIALLTRVLAADLHLAAAQSEKKDGRADAPAARRLPSLPLAMIGGPRQVAQAAGPPTSLGGQVSSAAGDMWATGSGGLTGKAVDRLLGEGNRYNKGTAGANAAMAWLKTILSVIRQNITIEVENDPLIRTKTRTPGERRTARCTVQIDLPKSDALKNIRALGNIAAIDLQLPDGGKQEGAKVVWRLLEGGEATKYQTANGAGTYRPDLAVVELVATGGGTVASFTDKEGEATATLQGKAQRRALPPTVRKYPRRAVVAVEVTLKVGNLTQDLIDAFNLAMGGPVAGAATFIADMILRTPFLFQNSKPFEVTDWKEPAWEGRFEILVTGSGSKHEKGTKGPDIDFEWRMKRYMEGQLHTPDWEEEYEQATGYNTTGRHTLEVDGDSRYFRLEDFSSSKTKDSHFQYDALGPVQVQPAGPNQLELFSRAEPSGAAQLTFSGGFMTLDLRPAFGALCYVGRLEQGPRRSWSKAGTESLGLLSSLVLDTFTIIEPNDGTSDTIDGTKTLQGKANLPYVPEFDVTVTISYHLKKHNPPPRSP